MNQDPQTILTAVLHRLGIVEAAVKRLESGRAANERLDADERDARRVAERMCLDPDVLADGTTHQRRLLAGALRQGGWSYQRIAVVLRCSERTVERYFSNAGRATPKEGI